MKHPMSGIPLFDEMRREQIALSLSKNTSDVCETSDVWKSCRGDRPVAPTYVTQGKGSNGQEQGGKIIRPYEKL